MGAAEGDVDRRGRVPDPPSPAGRRSRCPSRRSVENRGSRMRRMPATTEPEGDQDPDEGHHGEATEDVRRRRPPEEGQDGVAEAGGQRGSEHAQQDGDVRADPLLAGAALVGHREPAGPRPHQRQGGREVGGQPDDLEQQGEARGCEAAREQRQRDLLQHERRPGHDDEVQRPGVDRELPGDDHGHRDERQAEGPPGVEPGRQGVDVAQPLAEREPGRGERVVVAEHLHRAPAPPAALGVEGPRAAAREPLDQDLVVVALRQPSRSSRIVVWKSSAIVSVATPPIASSASRRSTARAAPVGGAVAVLAGPDDPVEERLLVAADRRSAGPSRG